MNATRIAVLVAVLTSVSQSFAQTIDSATAGDSCLVEANRIVKVSVHTAGTIEALRVERGSRVGTGDVIAELESSAERSLYEAARIRADSDVIVRSKKAEFEALDRKIEFQRKLAEREVVSRQSLQDTETELAVASLAVEQASLESQLAGAEAQRLSAALARRTVRAPVEGVVTAVETNVGEYADPTRPIVVIQEVQPLRLEVYLPVEYFRRVGIGMTAAVKLETPFANDPPLLAVVQTKDPSIDATSGTFQLGLRMDNPLGRVPAGLRCSVSIALPSGQ